MRLLHYFLILIMAITVLGCGKITKTNYDKIKGGMTVTEVEDILGTGIKMMNVSGQVLYKGSGKKAILITYSNERVVEKAADDRLGWKSERY